MNILPACTKILPRLKWNDHSSSNFISLEIPIASFSNFLAVSVSPASLYATATESTSNFNDYREVATVYYSCLNFYILS